MTTIPMWRQGIRAYFSSPVGSVLSNRLKRRHPAWPAHPWDMAGTETIELRYRPYPWQRAARCSRP